MNQSQLHHPGRRFRNILTGEDGFQQIGTREQLGASPTVARRQIKAPRSSKFESGIRMRTLGTRGDFSTGLLCIEMITADTVECNLAALGVVKGAIATIII